MVVTDPEIVSASACCDTVQRRVCMRVFFGYLYVLFTLLRVSYTRFLITSERSYFSANYHGRHVVHYVHQVSHRRDHRVQQVYVTAVQDRGKDS